VAGISREPATQEHGFAWRWGSCQGESSRVRRESVVPGMAQAAREGTSFSSGGGPLGAPGAWGLPPKRLEPVRRESLRLAARDRGLHSTLSDSSGR
jgi:hypothetical protein